MKRSLCCADEEKLQQTVDAAKAAEAQKYSEFVAANEDQIAKLQCDNESLQRVR